MIDFAPGTVFRPEDFLATVERHEAASYYRELRKRDPAHARAVWKWLRDAERKAHARMPDGTPRFRLLPTAAMLAF